MLIKYSHAAIPPVGIVVGQVYKIDEVKNMGLGMEDIKMLFSPVNGEWEQPKVEKAEPKKSAKLEEKE